MRNIWLVVKHDIAVTVRQRSFWIFTLIVPLMMLGISLSRTIGSDRGMDNESDTSNTQQQVSAPKELPAIALVDKAGVLSRMPPGFPQDLFQPFNSEQDALAALKTGLVQQVVSVPADFVSSGKLIVYAKDFNITSSGENMGVSFASKNEWVLPYLINYNLTGDIQLVAALRNPTPGELARQHRLLPVKSTSETSAETVDIVSAYMPYLFYFLLILSSSYLLRSVIAEKENRTAEVLLLSVHPRQLMAGKIAAMSAVMFIQLFVWALGGMLIFNRSLSSIDLSAFQFPPGFFAWAGIYLLLGYLLFASVMAAGGALASNPREVGQITFLLIIPLMPTLMFGPYFIENPDALLTIGMSLFPFSSPSVMVTRLAFGPVPAWQLIASLVLLAATAYLFLALAGRFFQEGNLLSEEPFRWSRMLRGLKKKQSV
jgi:ABC-2 type transport system permease protein